MEFVEFVNRRGEMWNCIGGLEGVNINTLFFVHYLALNGDLPLPMHVLVPAQENLIRIRPFHKTFLFYTPHSPLSELSISCGRTSKSFAKSKSICVGATVFSFSTYLFSSSSEEAPSTSQPSRTSLTGPEC